tara:strand:- start:690 stop:1652 length:963 start_codon:yes stop_codon:yes gene_type:complete
MNSKVNQKEFLKKINFKINNSKQVIKNPEFFNLSKIQIFIFNLLDNFLFLIFAKSIIKVSKYFENLLSIKNDKLLSLDPNYSPNNKSFNNLKISKKNTRYGYDEFSEIRRFFSNKKLILEKSNNGLLKTRIDFALKETKKIISKDLEVKKLLSIGCSYAYYESIIAKKWKNINVDCFDRSEITAILNKREFSFSNMSFSHGDLINFLENQKPQYSIFNHMYTTTYLPKDLVENIYSCLEKSLTKYIIIAEPFGISRETGEMYDFSFKEKPSVRFKTNCFIHNYPGILFKYNFSIINYKIVEVPTNRNSFFLYLIAKNNLI